MAWPELFLFRGLYASRSWALQVPCSTRFTLVCSSVKADNKDLSSGLVAHKLFHCSICSPDFSSRLVCDHLRNSRCAEQADIRDNLMNPRETKRTAALLIACDRDGDAVASMLQRVPWRNMGVELSELKVSRGQAIWTYRRSTADAGQRHGVGL
jgi:hypothetical protein